MDRQYTGIDSVRELLDRDLKAITEEELKMSAKRHSSLLETTMNTRDLGGYETGTPGVKTKYNRVYRSDKQNYPSERDIDFLKSNQVTTIIDMRGAEDIAKSSSGFAQREGFRYLNFPIEEGSHVPESVAAVPGSYMEIAHSGNISRVFHAIAEVDAGVMINCSAGKDRTGVASALLLSLCGVSRTDIITDYMITKECNRERFKMVRKNLPDVDINIVIPRESFMSDFLDLLYARYGCIENYFDAIGVDSAVQTAIREKILSE